MTRKSTSRRRVETSGEPGFEARESRRVTYRTIAYEGQTTEANTLESVLPAVRSPLSTSRRPVQVEMKLFGDGERRKELYFFDRTGATLPRSVYYEVRCLDKEGSPTSVFAGGLYDPTGSLIHPLHDPTGDETGWQNLFSGVSASVTDVIAYEGDKSFKLISWPTWSRTDYVALSPIPDRLKCKVSVYCDPTPERSVYIGFPAAFGNQGPFFNRIVINSGDGTTGIVLFTPRGSGSVTTELGQFEVGSWCTVRADFDYKNLVADFWLDGERVATKTTIFPREFDTWDYGHVVLNKWGVSQYNWPGGGTGTIYIDAVSLVSGGEDDDDNDDDNDGDEDENDDGGNDEDDNDGDDEDDD